jgi:hypothetical protein
MQGCGVRQVDRARHPALPPVVFWNWPGQGVLRSGQTGPEENTMRRLRFLIAIPAIAGLAIMGASGASAAPAHQAAHARVMTATSSGADPLVFENENFLYIEGSANGSYLTGTTDAAHATEYHYYPQPDAPGYYAYAPANGLCWNTYGDQGDNIQIVGCQANDGLQWFTSSADNHLMLSPWTHPDECIWGAGNGKTVYLHTCSSTNPRDLWSQ